MFFYHLLNGEFHTHSVKLTNDIYEYLTIHPTYSIDSPFQFA
ncbi:hypothetical protein THF1D04_30268 [Vibrio owensii]|uniref:Uncharacterized protein n=1 Tax=Vibrio owensii TaxID=696485 RepID=A0AAU9Q6V6_9VIBR|nr:hypothetical protein THF1D04_30268 [Vibrio owensii]